MRRTILFLLLGSVVVPTAAPAADNPSAPSAAKPDPAAKAAALKLANILYSEESQVRMAERMVDQEIGPAFRSNQSFMDLEAEYPGFIDALVQEFKPSLIRFTRRELPGYHDRVAELIASRLTAAEIEDLASFYKTPTGQKLVHGVQDNLASSSILKEAMDDPDKPASYGAIVSDHKAATEAATKLIDKADEPGLIALSQKPYFTRLAVLGPDMRKLEQDFMNEPAPEFEAEVEAIVKATLARFEGAKKR
ncbi:DUF2059 domain-containing protein [Sphingomonas alba]|uniref:DUF2059 domain-containing protein n=1 Tax=Sphingomonas alba TaxID=2908208 RepID=A0ABT0RMM5_9SPHN|nr:DUF2059 domain-containing protein [Sphingomonas alba]MCL6683896.1 DUF2059 domain-containing protein [Sphingomonas alba]